MTPPKLARGSCSGCGGRFLTAALNDAGRCYCCEAEARGEPVKAHPRDVLADTEVRPVNIPPGLTRWPR